MINMNCEQARNLFDAYLDGELPSTLDAELAAHRLHCTSCRHELALMQVAGHVIASDADTGVDGGLDGGFTDRLLACIEPSDVLRAGRWQRPWWIGRASLAAAAVVAIALTVWLSKPGVHVAGERIENTELKRERGARIEPDVDFGQSADSLVRQIESTWNTRAESAQSVIEFGQIGILQILDQFEVNEPSETDDTFEPLPESLDELAPAVASDDIEEL